MGETTWRRALVVGASSGVGAAMARALAREGCALVLLARRQAELEAVADACRADGAPRVDVRVHDVRHFEEVPATFTAALAALGGLDLFIYAAGVMPALDEGEYNFEKDRAVVEVNLLGAMAWMNPVAAHFEAQQGGTLLGVSSIAGERGRRGHPSYGSSKAGLTAYLEALRNRLSRHQVNVVTVKPGFVDTQMTRGKPGLFWLVSAEEAAAQALALARQGGGASGFVPRRWAAVAWAVRAVPSPLFRKLNV